MKSKTIFLILFFAVLAIVLTSCSIFKPNGNESVVMQVQATNTEYVVKDDSGNVIPNNSEIVIGDSYTITLVENPEYELKTFKINGTSVLEKLENNQYTFICNGTTMVTIISAVIVPGGEVISTYSISYVQLKHPSGVGIFNWSQLPDVDLLVYDAYGNVLAQLDEGETFTPNENEAYVVDAMFTNCTSRYKAKYCLGFINSLSVWNSVPCNITNVTQNYDFNLTYDFLGITFNASSDYATEAGIAIKVVDVGGNPTSDLEVGEQYTIIDTCNPGYEAVVKVNNEQVTLPHTFTYTEEIEIEVSAQPITIIPNVTAENCTYSFINENSEVVTELTFGETYTLTATANENYTIQNVTFNNEQVNLPYTFVALLNNEIVITTAEIVPYTPEVTATNATYSFTNANEEVVTELVQGTTYTLSAEPNQYYNLQETTFNGEVVTLPYTFVAGESAQVAINTIGMTVIPTIICTVEYCLIKDSEGNTVTELIYGDSYTVVFKPKYGYKYSYKINGGGSMGNYTDSEITKSFICKSYVNIECKTNGSEQVPISLIIDEGSYMTVKGGYYDSTSTYNESKSYNLPFGTYEYTFKAYVNDGYKLKSFSLNGVVLSSNSKTMYITSMDEYVFEVKTEKITTSNMTITYTGLPTDYKVYTDIYFYDSEDSTEISRSCSTADTSTGTTQDLSEYIGTYSYFTLGVCKAEGGNLASEYKITSAKLNGLSITLTTNEYGDYVYATKKSFPTTETYTLEITFTAVS